MRRRVSANHARGFSLVELLVVISIISLLIAILLPSLATARASAQRTQCLTQLRQIGFAALLYSGDFQGQYPNHYRGPTNSYGVIDIPVSSSWSREYQRGFYLLAANYVTAYETWFCPSNKSPGFIARDAFVHPVASAQSARGTYMWRFMTDRAAQPSTTDMRPILGVSPLAKPEIGQVYPSGEATVGYAAGYVVPPSRAAYAADLMAGYRTSPLDLGVMGTTHVDGVNATFFDGHGEYRSSAPLAKYPSPGTWSDDGRVFFRSFTYMIDVQRP